MLRFIFMRLLQAVPVLFIIATLTFFMVRLVGKVAAVYPTASLSARPALGLLLVEFELDPPVAAPGLGSTSRVNWLILAEPGRCQTVRSEALQG